MTTECIKLSIIFLVELLLIGLLKYSDSASSLQSIARVCQLFSDGTYACLSNCHQPVVDIEKSRGIPVSFEVSDPAYGVICSDRQNASNWSQEIGSFVISSSTRSAKTYYASCLFTNGTFECGSGPSCTISAVGKVICKGGIRMTGIYKETGNHGDPLTLQHRQLPTIADPLTATTHSGYS